MGLYTDSLSSTSAPYSYGSRATVSGRRRGFGNLFTVVLAGGAGMFVGASATLAGHIKATHDRLRQASERGRQASAPERLVTNSNGLPLTTVNHAGKPGDPI